MFIRQRRPELHVAVRSRDVAGAVAAARAMTGCLLFPALFIIGFGVWWALPVEPQLFGQPE